MMTIQRAPYVVDGPSDRTERRVQRAIWAAIAVVLVVIAVLAGALIRRAISHPAGPEPAGRGAIGAAPSETPDPLAAIPGARIADLTAWWSARWRTDFRYDNRTYSATVTPPGGGSQLTISASQPPQNVLGWSREVRCRLDRDGLTVDRATLDLLVAECLDPVLQDRERQEVPEWLSAEVTNLPVGELRSEEFPRFNLLAEHVGADTLILTLRAR
jgi:hypothetical protein